MTVFPGTREMNWIEKCRCVPGPDGRQGRVMCDRPSGSFTVCGQQPIHIRGQMLQPSEMKGPRATWHQRFLLSESFSVVFWYAVGPFYAKIYTREKSEPDCSQRTADGSHVERIIEVVGQPMLEASIWACSTDFKTPMRPSNPQICFVLHQ